MIRLRSRFQNADRSNLIRKLYKRKEKGEHGFNQRQSIQSYVCHSVNLKLNSVQMKFIYIL